MSYTDEQIAEAIHTVNGLLQRFHGEDHCQPPWDQAPPAMRARTVELVRSYRSGVTPRGAHEAWVRQMRAEGYTWGAVRDHDARTHPNLVPYGELPRSQQVKDVVSHQLTAILVTESRL